MTKKHLLTVAQKLLHLGIVLMMIWPILAYPAPASACLCSDELSQPSTEKFSHAEVVFIGQVTSIRSNFPTALFYDMYNQIGYWLGFAANTAEHGKFSDYRVILEVSQSWKGVNTSTVEIITGGGYSGDCGYPFAIGTQYLIYGYTDNDKNLFTSICQPTEKLSQATEDLNYLNKIPVISLTSVPVSQFRSGMALCTLLLLVSLIILGGIYRRRLIC